MRNAFGSMALAAAAAWILGCGAAAPARTAGSSAGPLYVSVDGSDRNSGTADAPFATLARARDAARGADGPVVIRVRQGTHYFPETLVFGPEDSRSAEAPMTVVAAAGELVTLSGGRKLECDWQAHENGILKTSVPAGLAFDQLFINGKRQIRARFPDYDAADPRPYGKGYINMAQDKENDWPATFFFYDPATFTKKRWARPQEAIVNTFPETYIASQHWQVAALDTEGHRVLLGRGGFHLNDLIFGPICTGIGPKSRFFIENVFEELDAPGEWYLDKDASVLYYMPAKGVDVKNALVEVPQLKRLIEFRGSQEVPVRNITLSGFHIAHTASTLLDDYEAPSNGDWTIHRGGTVFFEGAEDCAVERCFFDAVGGNGVFVNKYNRGIRVTGNKFTEAGDSAVCIVGDRRHAIGSVRCYPSENTVSNNLVHHCGVFGKQTAAVFLSITRKNVVSHNLIHDMPRTGIEINDGWGGGHLVEFNRIFNTSTETSDHGSINSWGRERYWCLSQSHGPASHPSGSPMLTKFPDVRADSMFTTIIRNNYCREKCEWTINLDDGSSNYHLYNNVSVGASIKTREGDFRTIENNVIYHPKSQPGWQLPYEDNRDIFSRNIVVTTVKPPDDGSNIKRPGVGSQLGDCYAHIWPPPGDKRMCQEADNNVFWSDAGKFVASIVPMGANWNTGEGCLRLTLKEWQAKGYDQNSVFADPMFVDPEHDDFRVKPESPALKLGFKNFDVRSAGLLPDFPQEWKDPE